MFVLIVLFGAKLEDKSAHPINQGENSLIL